MSCLSNKTYCIFGLVLEFCQLLLVFILNKINRFLLGVGSRQESWKFFFFKKLHTWLLVVCSLKVTTNEKLRDLCMHSVCLMAWTFFFNLFSFSVFSWELLQEEKWNVLFCLINKYIKILAIAGILSVWSVSNQLVLINASRCWYWCPMCCTKTCWKKWFFHIVLWKTETTRRSKRFEGMWMAWYNQLKWGCWKVKSARWFLK